MRPTSLLPPSDLLPEPEGKDTHRGHAPPTYNRVENREGR